MTIGFLPCIIRVFSKCSNLTSIFHKLLNQYYNLINNFSIIACDARRARSCATAYLLTGVQHTLRAGIARDDRELFHQIIGMFILGIHPLILPCIIMFSKPISQATKLILGMFVLIWMHFNNKIAMKFQNVGPVVCSRLLHGIVLIHVGFLQQTAAWYYVKRGASFAAMGALGFLLL